MEKKLRSVSMFCGKGSRCPFADKNSQKMKADLKEYFDTAVPGQSITWADGTLTMQANHTAIYRTQEGFAYPVKIGIDSNLFVLYNGYEGIRKAWDAEYGKAGVGACPFAVDNPTVIWKHVSQSMVKTEIRNTEYLETTCESNFLMQPHIDILNLIAHEVALQYPQRHNQQLSVLDACLPDRDAPGHPQGSHPQSCVTFDLHYYTMGEYNRTQLNQIGPHIDIWTDGELNQMFDTDRVLAMVLLLIDAFPMLTSGEHTSNRILQHPKIKAKLIEKAKLIPAEFGQPPVWQKVNYAINTDEVARFNHHLHMHVFAGSEINWSATL